MLCVGMPQLTLQRPVRLLREAILYCESVKDFVPAKYLPIFWKAKKSISTGWKPQLELIEKVGLQNYLQSQM